MLTDDGARLVDDVGATTAAGDVMIGHRLGLYHALADGPLAAWELADRTDTPVRPVREWLRGQAANGTVAASGDGRFILPVDLAGSLPAGSPEQDEEVLLAAEAFLQAGHASRVATEWIPALGGVEQRLQSGGRIADVGCGLGTSSIVMARAYPAARVSGSDVAEGDVALARRRAARASVGDRTAFEVASATTFTGTGFDLVVSVDRLLATGDPTAVARHVRAAVAQHGCWMVVEPTADDDHDPVGRMWALGARATLRAITDVTREAGFTRCERVTGTPFHDVYAVRP